MLHICCDVDTRSPCALAFLKFNLRNAINIKISIVASVQRACYSCLLTRCRPFASVRNAISCQRKLARETMRPRSAVPILKSLLNLLVLSRKVSGCNKLRSWNWSGRARCKKNRKRPRLRPATIVSVATSWKRYFAGSCQFTRQSAMYRVVVRLALTRQKHTTCYIMCLQNGFMLHARIFSMRRESTQHFGYLTAKY